MKGELENAAGVRGVGTFPRAWGTPPGTSLSEERAAWVRRHALLQSVRDVDTRAARQECDRIHRGTHAGDPDHRCWRC